MVEIQLPSLGFSLPDFDPNYVIVDWSVITNIPSCFIPCSHTHTVSQITDWTTAFTTQFFTHVTNTSTINLTNVGDLLNADLNLSTSLAPLNFLKLTLTAESDGLLGVIRKSDSTHDGYLSAPDWITFNSKATAFTLPSYMNYAGSELRITGLPNANLANDNLTLNGVLLILGTSSTMDLINLNDVLIVSPANDDALLYNSGNSSWQNTALSKSLVGLSLVDNIQQLPLSYLSIDGTLGSDSDLLVPSQKAVKTYSQPLIVAESGFGSTTVVENKSTWGPGDLDIIQMNQRLAALWIAMENLGFIKP